MDKVVGKIIVLREICENKSVLFGPFSEEVTLQRKVDIWTQVLNKAKSLGLISYDKDYRYMRDVFWQNLKRSALGKRGYTKKTGREKNFSPIDDLVFEILNKSNVTEPPSETKTFTPKEEDQHSRDLTIEYTAVEEEEEEEDIDRNPNDHNPNDQHPNNDNPNVVYLQAPEGVSPARKKRRPNKKKPCNDERVKKKKMALQLEQIEMQNYKLKLELLEIEQRLGFKPSKYTKDIAKKMKTNNNAVNNVSNHSDPEESDSDDSA